MCFMLSERLLFYFKILFSRFDLLVRSKVRPTQCDIVFQWKIDFVFFSTIRIVFLIVIDKSLKSKYEMSDETMINFRLFFSFSRRKQNESVDFIGYSRCFDHRFWTISFGVGQSKLGNSQSIENVFRMDNTGSHHHRTNACWIRWSFNTNSKSLVKI